MNKKLITIAVGAAIAATPFFAAQAADVKVYGRLEVELVDSELDVNYYGYSYSSSYIFQGDGSGQSRFGFKVTEDLGGGLKAIGVWEEKIEVSNNPPGIIDGRQQYVALKGSFGEVAFGQLPGAYKMTGGAKLDPFNATFLQARRSGGQAGGSWGANGFRADMIRYKNKFGPISVDVQTSLDETSNDGDTSLGVMFKQGPLEVFAATNEDDSSGLGNSKVGARYKFGAFKVWGQLESTEISGTFRDGVGNNLLPMLGDWKYMLFGGSYKMGKNIFVVQLGTGEQDNGGPTETTYTTLGVIHKFSKKTRVYGGIKTAEMTDFGGGLDLKLTETGVGMRVDF